MTGSATPRAHPVSASAATAGDMETIGRRLGEALAAEREAAGPAVVVYLRGPLGAGKTTVARGVLRAFGTEGIVRSPTYTLVEPYETGHGGVVHVDLYRLSRAEEVEFLGLEGYLDYATCLIEWPERGAGELPRADLDIAIDADTDPRRVSISPMTGRAVPLLDALARRLKVSESI